MPVSYTHLPQMSDAALTRLIRPTGNACVDHIIRLCRILHLSLIHISNVVCSLESVDKLITDAGIDPAFRQALEEKGIDVIITGESNE